MARNVPSDTMVVFARMAFLISSFVQGNFSSGMALPTMAHQSLKSLLEIFSGTIGISIKGNV
jgi:hypothetical protein